MNSTILLSTRRLLSALIFALLFLHPVMGMEESYLGVVSVGDFEEVEIANLEGVRMEPSGTMKLHRGYTISTGETSAELEFSASGSRIYLENFTTIRIEGFQTGRNSSNDLFLSAGRIRMVTSDNSGGNNYNIFSNSSICTIQGTDFSFDAGGLLSVFEGVVLFIKSSTGEELRVGAGMMANAQDANFVVSEIPQERMIAEAPKPSQRESGNSAPAGDSGDSSMGNKEGGSGGDASDPAAGTPGTPNREPESDLKFAKVNVLPPPSSSRGSGVNLVGGGDANPRLHDRLPEFARDLIAMEIGTVTIDDTTYTKLIMQPRIKAGKFEMALHLPVIYGNDLLDFNSWYKPRGNNEWSFGSDQSGAFDIAMDILGDLVLKIQYMQWGNQRDPFFFKFGNFSNATLGHGILLQDYSNNSDFPSTRKVGLNLGFNNDYIGLELLGDDLANPQLFGLRFVYRPTTRYRMGIAISGVTDINPEAYMESKSDRDPIFFSPALDLEFPVFSNPLLSVLLYSDLAVMLPVADGKMQTNFVYDGSASGLDKLRNYGVSIGTMGNIAMVNYRLEYRLSSGLFRNAFYGDSYDRLKGGYVTEMLEFLDGPEAVTLTHGIYGSFDADILGIVTLGGGYFAPWSSEGFAFDRDHFHFKVALNPGVIPVVGLYGSFWYSRTGLVESIVDGDFKFIDGSTVLKGELVYPIRPTLDLAVTLTSTLSRDEEGVANYTAAGEPEAQYTLSIETRIHL